MYLIKTYLDPNRGARSTVRTHIHKQQPIKQQLKVTQPKTTNIHKHDLPSPLSLGREVSHTHKTLQRNMPKQTHTNTSERRTYAMHSLR